MNGADVRISRNLLQIVNASSMNTRVHDFVLIDVIFPNPSFWTMNDASFHERVRVGNELDTLQDWWSWQMLSGTFKLDIGRILEISAFNSSLLLSKENIFSMILPSQVEHIGILQVFDGIIDSHLKIMVPFEESLKTSNFTLTYVPQGYSFERARLVNAYNHECTFSHTVDASDLRIDSNATIVTNFKDEGLDWRHSDVFVEIQSSIEQRQRVQVGMAMMMKPAMQAICGPVIDDTVEFAKRDVMPVFEEQIFQTLMDKVSPIITPKVKAIMLPIIAIQLISALPKAFTEALVESLVESLGPYLAQGLASKVSPELASSLGEMMMTYIPTVVGHEVSEGVDRMLLLSLSHSLSRSLSYAITASLSNMIQTNPTKDNSITDACRICFKDISWQIENIVDTTNDFENVHLRSPVSCNRCPFSKQSVYYHSYYSAYYSDWYSEYYADYYAEAFLKRDIVNNK